jgi:hypothetical protein
MIEPEKPSFEPDTRTLVISSIRRHNELEDLVENNLMSRIAALEVEVQDLKNLARLYLAGSCIAFMLAAERVWDKLF